MIKKWLIDSDVLIDHLRGSAQATEFLSKVLESHECYISSITIAELYAGVREGREKDLLDKLIKEFRIAEINESIAKQGGLLRRDYGKSHDVGLADALIAATAQVLHLTIATLNKKHYPMIERIQVPYSK